MGNVLKCNGDPMVGADADVEWAVTAGHPTVYATFEVYITTAALAQLFADHGGTVAFIGEIGAGGTNDLYLNDTMSTGVLDGIVDDVFGSSVGGLTGSAWHTLEWSLVPNGGTLHLRVDATDDTTVFGGFSEGDITYVKFGAMFRVDEPVYLRTIKIGTTPGGSDLLDYDPATDGDPATFGFTVTGDVTVVPDPVTPPTPQPEGVSIAFNSGPLDDTPSWQRIDNYPGVTIQQVTTERGRMDETEKVAVGLCTITGTDRAGVLDPTNTTGPFYGKLDPVKQVGVAIWDPVTSVWATRYTGYWDQLTYVIDPSGKFATFTLDCVDAMDILTDAEVIPGHAGLVSVPAGSEGNAVYASQQVNDRILAALADGATALLGITWPATLLNIFSGNVLMTGSPGAGSVYSPRSPVLQVIQDASDAEFPMVSNFFVDRNGVIDFRGRLARFDPTNPTYNINFWKIGDDLAFAADSTVARMVTPFQFTRGKKNLINAAYCAPQGIAAADSAGQLVTDMTSIGKYAVRSTSFEGLEVLAGDEGPPLSANDETKLYGQYLVDNYKDPQNRPQTVVVKGLPPSNPQAAPIWALLSGAELSDVVTLKTTHPGGGGFDHVDFFIEKISEVILPRHGTATGDDVTTTYEISPRAYFVTNPFS